MKEVNEYNMEIFKAVIKNFEKDKNFRESDAFREALKQTIKKPYRSSKNRGINKRKT